MAITLLFIQSKKSANQGLLAHLESANYNIQRTEDVASAINLIDDNGLRPSAILVDIPDITERQVEMLEGIEGSLGILEWVCLTYELSDELSDRLEEMNCRALKTPCSFLRIEIAVRKAIRTTIVRRRLFEYSNKNLRKNSFDSIVGSSPALTEHRRVLKELSQIPLSTLKIRGETGTGKGHAAKILHDNGLRQEYAFIDMNCAAIPTDLVESQLFGHEAGAFTGAKKRHRGVLEQAHNGTLFLDEIGEMSLDTQAKLLKVIEEQCFRRVGGEHEINVDVQIFAASNRNLQKRILAGEFREDLYHRLTVFQITVPALREYKSDLVELVPLIIAEYNAKAGKRVTEISDEAWKLMTDYDWPGNIRELRNALERSVLLSKDNRLNTNWLNLDNTLLEKQLENVESELDGGLSLVDVPVEKVGDSHVESQNQLVFSLDGKTSLEDMDQEIIQRALQLSHHNLSKAAELLGATRETLRYRVQKYGLG